MVDAALALIHATGVSLDYEFAEGGKSANVTLSEPFESFANVRPAREHPGTPPFAGRGVDLVIVREDVEDPYAGIEYMQTPNVAPYLELVSRGGSRRIAQAGFALAEAEGRLRVTGGTKANNRKLTEGPFKRAFEAAARDYPLPVSMYLQKLSSMGRFSRNRSTRSCWFDLPLDARRETRRA